MKYFVVSFLWCMVDYWHKLIWQIVEKSKEQNVWYSITQALEMDLWVASLVVVAKEGTPYKWKITNDYFKLEVFDFVEKCMECRNWVAQCKAKDWFGEIGLCSSSKRRVLEMDVGVASDWWIWLLWPPSTQTNVYRSSIICICKVQVSFYQTLSLFHLSQCHIDPPRLHFLVLSGWSTLWKLQ